MVKEYKLTAEQKAKLLEAMKPVPYMIIGGVAPRSQQEKANDAWKALGKELGFKHMTVRPCRGKSEDYFTAEEITPEELLGIKGYHNDGSPI